MDPNEAYSLLFSDIFVDALLLPVYKQYALSTMLALGHFHNGIIFTLCVLASTLASILNGALGWITISIAKVSPVPLVDSDNDNLIVELLKKYALIPVILFSSLPVVGALMPVLAGFFRFPLWKIALCSAVSACGYYAYTIFYSI